jgi:hypothetical protein
MVLTKPKEALTKPLTKPKEALRNTSFSRWVIGIVCVCVCVCVLCVCVCECVLVGHRPSASLATPEGTDKFKFCPIDRPGQVCAFEFFRIFTFSFFVYILPFSFFLCESRKGVFLAKKNLSR